MIVQSIIWFVLEWAIRKVEFVGISIEDLKDLGQPISKGVGILILGVKLCENLLRLAVSS